MDALCSFWCGNRIWGIRSVGLRSSLFSHFEWKSAFKGVALPAVADGHLLVCSVHCRRFLPVLGCIEYLDYRGPSAAVSPTERHRSEMRKSVYRHFPVVTMSSQLPRLYRLTII